MATVKDEEGTARDERVLEILRGTRVFRDVEFPGREGLVVSVRCLTEAELDNARVATQVGVRTIAQMRGWDPTSVVDVDPDLFQRLLEREIVQRAFYVADGAVEKRVPFFPSTRDVAELLDSVAMTRLMDAYIEHQQRVSPMRDVPEGEIGALIERMGKESAPELVLAAFGPDTLRRLLLSTVSVLRATISRTGK